MEIFEKLRTTLSSPLRQGQQQQCLLDIKTWTLPLASFTEKSIRLLLYRDCDRRGRKCLYDSHHVVRDKNGKFSYIPSGSELKQLSEYIFGCVPLCSSNSTKRFHKFNGKFIWSKVFCPRAGRPKSGDSTKSGELTLSTTCAPQIQSDLGNTTGNNSSLPNIIVRSPGNIKTCLSLPSRLESNQKTLLGLAILIETNHENKDALGPYLLSMAKSFEESSDWFSSVASKAYCKSDSFVPTLFDFSQEFTGMLYTRLTSPLISTVALTPCWKTLPHLTSELVNLLLRLDSCLCKAGERIKLVIVGSNTRKASQEVKALLYLFKLLLIKCKDEEEVGVDAAASSLCEISTPKIEVPSQPVVSTVQQYSFVIPQPKIENEKLQKKEYDSGIDMSYSSLSIKSLRKSVSQKFDSSDSCSGFSSDEGIGIKMKPSSRVHEYEEVSFHLGELESDSYQSVKTLGLGEPNLNKLKIHHSSVSYFEPVHDNIETLSSDPLEVKLDFCTGSSPSTHLSYCQYCDSVAAVNKFSPLYYIQWLKTGITEDDFNRMKKFNSKFVIINLDKSFIRTVNFEFCPTSCPLVDSLVNKINILTSSGRESEVDQFLSIQMEFMKKIAHELGSRLQTTCDYNLVRKHFSHLSDNDFDLINFLAKMKFPYLKTTDNV